MKPAFFFVCLLFAAGPLAAQEVSEEIEVEVSVLPRKGGAGKFSEANIVREENRVIQAPFGGGPGSVLAHVASAPDGSLLLCGRLGGAAPGAALPFTAASAGRGTAFAARLSPDARTITAIVRLPEMFASAGRITSAPGGAVVVAGSAAGGGLAVAKLSAGLDALLWVRQTEGDAVASVSAAPDGSVVVCPVASPFVSRIAPDGKSLMPFGGERFFRIDGANPEITRAWWEGCGYAAAGYKGGVTYQRGGNAGVVALPDGAFAHFSCHFLRHPGGGPDFDPMLIKFDAGGRVLWASNLLDGLPAESDHKNPGMALDPHTGDLLLSAIQHGHFTHNLIHTSGAYQNPHPYQTGNIMIGWLARVDARTGKVKAATYFFPELPGGAAGGKKRANSLFPLAPAADAAGNLYVTGRAAHRFETTLHAFQSEGGSGAFIAAFSPDLGRLLYASLLTAPGYDLTPAAIALAPGGPVTVGSYTRKKGAPDRFDAANAEVTNYLLPAPAAPAGGFVNYTPSGPWLGQ